jgi:hypothetical protein
MATRAAGVAALVGVLALHEPAAAQPAKLTVGVYAPTVEFGTAQARLAYAQGLARAIEQSTGIKTDAQAYATLAALRKDAVDFAIVDGPCVATNPSWKLLATSTSGGATTRTWVLYSSAGESLASLKGKKLAFVALGCSDTAFIDNAMLEGEVDAAFFGARLGEKDLTGAIASVTSYKTAHAVFAPSGSAKGLTKVFDAASVPNPAFVELSDKVPDELSERVANAVLSYSASSAIGGWTRPSREPYQAFAARLAPVKKVGVFATPEVVQLDARDVIAAPVMKEPALVPVRQLFVRPGLRMQ